MQVYRVKAPRLGWDRVNTIATPHVRWPSPVDRTRQHDGEDECAGRQEKRGMCRARYLRESLVWSPSRSRRNPARLAYPPLQPHRRCQAPPLVGWDQYAFLGCKPFDRIRLASRPCSMCSEVLKYRHFFIGSTIAVIYISSALINNGDDCRVSRDDRGGLGIASRLEVFSFL